MNHQYTLNVSTTGAFRVDIPTYCKNAPFIELPPGSSEGIFTINPDEAFNSEWLHHVNSVLPAPIVGAFAFKRTANRKSIHSDFYPPHRMFLYALNFLIQPQQSRMMWYNIAGEVVDEVDIPSDRLLLVNTAQWHDVDVGGVERWCVSLRPADCIYDPANPLGWDQIVKKYQHLLF